MYREYNINNNENWISGFNNQQEDTFVASATDARLVQYLSSNLSGNNIPIAPVPVELNLGGQETF